MIENTPAFVDFPISVVMQRKSIEDNIWIAEKWEVEAIVAGGENEASVPRRRITRIGQDSEMYIWSNYQITLYKDEVESYYFNIITDTPYVFVSCRDENANGQLVPVSVSVSYDEAGSHMEMDDQVFQVPMPPEIYRWVEAFVINNYVPVKKKKRKLQNWSADNQQVGG